MSLTLAMLEDKECWLVCESDLAT